MASLTRLRMRPRSAVFDAATLRTLGKGAFVYMDPDNGTLMHVALSPDASIPLTGRLGIQQASPPVLVDSLLNTPVLNGNIPGGLLAWAQPPWLAFARPGQAWTCRPQPPGSHLAATAASSTELHYRYL